MIHISRETVMAKPSKARVFMTGRSQAVRIPAEFRFSTDEVYVRRDPQTGDLILSQLTPSTWTDVFTALDQAGFPPEFMANRQQGDSEDREPL